MDKKNFSTPIDLKQVKITDAFWKREQELVRTEVIPYQWEALNDRVEGVAPSYCMHNFVAAGRMMQQKKTDGAEFKAPEYTFRGFEMKPENGVVDPDKFYGFVFQDTDFSKWIEAVAYSLTWHPDAGLEKIADGAIDIVCAAQAENGYLDTYYILNGMDRAFTNLRDHHELYCLGHLIEGAIAYYQATGKDKLLNAARHFADYAAEYFGSGEGQCKGYPGHEIAEMALARLYEVTGEEKYLNLSKFFIDQRGREPYYFDEEAKRRAELDGTKYVQDENPDRYAYHQAHKPVRQQEEAVGHAVRGGYLYSGMADVARLTQDEELYAACRKLWESIATTKLYITGGIGGTVNGEAFSYPYDLRNDQAYSETCAAISLAFFARRMLQIEADSAYGDVMEMALYNTVLSGMALDGKSFFYVNPLEVVPEACHKDERLFHVKPVRQKWFGCACCPPNIARTVSSIAAYAYTKSDDTLYSHLYMGSVICTDFGGKEVEIHVGTDMPWDGHVSVGINVLDKTAVNCRLAFRVPRWAGETAANVCCGGRKYKLTLGEEGKLLILDYNFKELSGADEFGLDATMRNGYLYLCADWQSGDNIEFVFAMDIRMKSADLKVREDVGKVAFRRGPITYCMEEADNGANLHLCRVDVNRIGEHCEGIKTVPSSELGHEMVVLEVPGLRQKNVASQDTPSESKLPMYNDYRFPVWEPTTLKFIPYYAWANRGEGEMSVWVRT